MLKRNIRPRHEIDRMTEAAIAFAQRYPTVSEHSLAVTQGWSQTGLQRALECRSLSLPYGAGRGHDTVESLIVSAAFKNDNFASLKQLLADIAALKTANVDALVNPRFHEDATEDYDGSNY